MYAVVNKHCAGWDFQIINVDNILDHNECVY